MASSQPPRQRRARPTGSKRNGIGPPTGRAALAGAPPPLTARGTNTREEILAASRSVFARMGYGGTRLEDIAAEAGVSRSTVYHYFSSRQEIFIAIGKRALVAYQDVIAAARAIPDEWTEDELAALIDTELRFLDEHGSIIPIWTQATWDDPELRELGLRAQLRDFADVGAEIARLRGAADIDPVHEGIAFTGTIQRLWYFARNGGGRTIDDDGMRATLLVELVGRLTRPTRTDRPTDHVRV